MFRAKRKDVQHIKERAVGSPSARHGSVRIKESYEEIRKIGEGGQGKLWIVERKSDRKRLVRKEQKTYHMYGSVPSEMYIFENVLTPHPRIIDFDHASYMNANGTLVLYFEHCKGGDLHQYIPRGGGRGVSEQFLWRVFIQIADALAFLHYGYNRSAKDPNTPPRKWRRVVHRDIKPENIFLRHKLTSSNPDPELVLGDFGLATLNQETADGCGTHEWCGPEFPVMAKENDVWALGGIIHALAHGRGPVPNTPRDWPLSGREWRTYPGARQPKNLPQTYSSALNRNMMDCLEMDPRYRITSLQLVKNLVATRPKARR